RARRRSLRLTAGVKGIRTLGPSREGARSLPRRVVPEVPCGAFERRFLLSAPRFEALFFCACEEVQTNRSNPNLMRFFELTLLWNCQPPVLPSPGSRELKRDRAGS